MGYGVDGFTDFNSEAVFGLFGYDMKDIYRCDLKLDYKSDTDRMDVAAALPLPFLGFISMWRTYVYVRC